MFTHIKSPGLTDESLYLVTVDIIPESIFLEEDTVFVFAFFYVFREFIDIPGCECGILLINPLEGSLNNNIMKANECIPLRSNICQDPIKNFLTLYGCYVSTSPLLSLNFDNWLD